MKAAALRSHHSQSVRALLAAATVSRALMCSGTFRIPLRDVFIHLAGYSKHINGELLFAMKSVARALSPLAFCNTLFAYHLSQESSHHFVYGTE